MKEKYRKYLLVVVVFIVVVIFVDIIFNFSGILMNNYKETFYGESASEESQVNNNAIQEYERIEQQPIKSIVSKVYGKVVNIQPVNLTETPTRRFMLKINGKALSVNTDGTYGMVLSNNEDIRQHWQLERINSSEEYVIALGNSNNGYNVTKVSYPFYICKSVYDINQQSGIERALQYEGGYISVRPIGNYDNQKWDVSNNQLESNIQLHNTTSTPNMLSDTEYSYGNYYSSEQLPQQTNTSEKLNINLKLNQEVIDQLFGNRIGNNGVNVNGASTSNGNGSTPQNRSFAPSACSIDNWIPRNSVRSVCNGCDPDLIDPPV